MTKDELAARYRSLSWAWDQYFYSDIDRAIEMIKEAIDIAEQLDNPIGRMEMRHWLAQALIFRKRDFTNGLPLAVESAVEIRKPMYEGLYTRVCHYQDLIAAHVGADALSHEPTIERALASMEQEAEPNSQCVRCLAGERFAFEMARGDIAAAEKSAKHKLSIAYTSHHKSHALVSMAEVNFELERWDDMLAHAKAAQKQGEIAKTEDVVLDALLYQAIGYWQLGDQVTSADFYSQYLAKCQLSSSTPVRAHYRALVAYHLMQSERDKAIARRREQLAALEGKGALRDSAEAHVSLCELLHESGQLAISDIANAQTAVAKLKVDGGLADQLARLSDTSK